MQTQPLTYPKLRSLSFRSHIQDGHPYLLLSDPQQVSDASLLVAQPLATVLAFCDGTRDRAGLATAFAEQVGFSLPQHLIDDLLARLDEALFLENERFQAAYQLALDTYRSAPYRTAALAGLSYPAQKTKLWRLLQDYLKVEEATEPLAVDWSRPVGLLSPHIDYPRGGAIYAQVWKRAA